LAAEAAKGLAGFAAAGAVSLLGGAAAGAAAAAAAAASAAFFFAAFFSRFSCSSGALRTKRAEGGVVNTLEPVRCCVCVLWTELPAMCRFRNQRCSPFLEPS
jgi:hypothetical protein